MSETTNPPLSVPLQDKLDADRDPLNPGWLTNVTRFISPNCDERPVGSASDLVVIHNISLPPDEFGGTGVSELFTNQLNPAAHPYYAEIAHLRVSAHFFIRRDGEIQQFVSADKRAWHAGVSSWGGRERCNDFSIGIELEGSDFQAFTPIQYQQLAQLLQRLHVRYPSLQQVTGHAQIAPGRKTDPGPYFDWAWLKQNTALVVFSDTAN